MIMISPVYRYLTMIHFTDNSPYSLKLWQSNALIAFLGIPKTMTDFSLRVFESMCKYQL